MFIFGETLIVEMLTAFMVSVKNITLLLILEIIKISNNNKLW